MLVMTQVEVTRIVYVTHLKETFVASPGAEKRGSAFGSASSR